MKSSISEKLIKKHDFKAIYIEVEPICELWPPPLNQCWIRPWLPYTVVIIDEIFVHKYVLNE